MKKLFIYVITTVVIHLNFNVEAQENKDIKESLRKMAEEKKYGILFCQVGKTGLTSFTTSFVGLIDINIENNRLDTILSMKELQSEESRKALVDLCQQLVKKGVSFRSEYANEYLSILCYRLPLYYLCAEKEMMPARIVTYNLWVAKQQAYYNPTDIKNVKALELIKNDASYLLKKHQPYFESKYLESSELGNDVFLVYRRIAEIANNIELRRDILISKTEQDNKNSIDNYLLGTMEELAQTSLHDILIDETNEINKFDKIWGNYLKYRVHLNNNPSSYTSTIASSYDQFSSLRSEAQSAGGSFGHKISYMISEYMQVLGRDYAYLNVLTGKSLEALKITEKTRGRSLGDWIARSHPNTRMKSRYIYGLNDINKRVIQVEPASINEMARASIENKANILIYLTVQDKILAWLIMPNGKYFFSKIADADTLISQLFSIFPYNIIPSKSSTNTVELKSRSTIKSSVSANKKNPQTLLSSLFTKLLPDSIGATVSSGNAEKLIIIPDGLLNYVPFQALIDHKGNYLLKNNEISYWPSVTSWLIMKDAEEVFYINKSAENKIKVLGNPIFNGEYPITANGKQSLANLSPLPGTGKEIKAIGKLFNTNVIEQNNVIIDSFLQKDKVNIVHLATHGYSNLEEGMNSFIAFSDGPLYAETMYEKAGILKSRLVVLSACQTGIGSLINDSPISLTNSFLVAGANNVTSTLWSIDDEASSELMIEFYKNIKDGKSISNSLRLAQLYLMQQNKWNSPYFWAAFKTTGVDTNPLK